MFGNFIIFYFSGPYVFGNREKDYRVYYPVGPVMNHGDQIVFLYQAYSTTPTFKTKKELKKTKKLNLSPIAYFTGIFTFEDKYTMKNDMDISTLSKIYSN